MKLDEFKKKAELVKNDERYRIYDYKKGKLVVSLTELKSHQETKGHSHPGIGEAYYFLEGKGKIQLGEKIIEVEEGDVIPIPDGEFHKVFNLLDKELRFFTFFEKYERE